MSTVTITDEGKCRKKLSFIVPEEEVRQEYENVYREFSQHVHINGFRKGMVPRDIVVKRYGKEATQQVLEVLVPRVYFDALQEHKLEPIEEPVFSPFTLENNKAFSFEATFDVEPTFELPSYEGITLKAKKAEVTDEDVDKVLNDFRDFYARFEIATTDTVAQGNLLMVDYTVASGGKTIEHFDNYSMMVENNVIHEDVLKALVGAKKGATVAVDITMPDVDQPKYKDYAGKPVTITIVIKEIKVKELPEINDAFAAMLGNYKNLDEVKKDIRTRLGDKNAVDWATALKTEAAVQLAGAAKMTLPEAYCTRREQRIKDAFKDHMQRHKVPAADLEKELVKKEKEFKEQAVEEVKREFVLRAIFRKENLTLTEPEREQTRAQFLQQAGKDEQASMKEFLFSGRGRKIVDNIVMERKALDFVVEKAVKK